jgi:general secretion pathway protein E
MIAGTAKSRDSSIVQTFKLSGADIGASRAWTGITDIDPDTSVSRPRHSRATTVMDIAVPIPLTVETLAQALADQGCDPRALERGRRGAADSGQRLDAVLLQLGLVSERQLAEAASTLLGAPVVTPDAYPAVLPACVAGISPRFLRDARVVPLSDVGGTLALAMVDPLDTFTPAALSAAVGRRVTVAAAVPVELEAALNRLLPEQTADPATGEDDSPLEQDAERLKDLASEAPVIRLVNQIIGRAVEIGASDIHIEPFEDVLRVRYRLDGELQEAESPPQRLAAAITSRIKIMAKLDIAERRLPQDGRIQLAVRGQDVDFRVSTVATMYGESVVLRILDRNAVTFEWRHLGLAPAVVQRLTRSLDRKDGIVLVTGPTGSGKTTTLYTALLTLNSINRKIVTIEDPVEYHLRGINQIQVQPLIKLTFDRLLQWIVRQDPNVIMVGEIRNLETALTAVQAALTGHLVLSTLHTNSAAASITQLRHMGVDDYQIAAVLRGVMAQRLVRRLCLACRQPGPAAPELVRRFALDRDNPGQPVTLFHPVGCPACRGTGYWGRLAIAEFLEPDDTIRRLIFSRAADTDIERSAIAGGMVQMFRAGIDAALAGETTIEEVGRAVEADDP